LRRYVRHVSPRSELPPRYMTREERRQAMEVLLSGPTSNKNSSPSEVTDSKEIIEQDEADEMEGDCEVASSGDEPVCSICLGGYNDEMDVLVSQTCPHQFHKVWIGLILLCVCSSHRLLTDL
jgi:hypothetical protein